MMERSIKLTQTQVRVGHSIEIRHESGVPQGNRSQGRALNLVVWRAPIAVGALLVGRTKTTALPANTSRLRGGGVTMGRYERLPRTLRPVEGVLQEQ